MTDATAGAGAGAPTAGRLLREARERQGLHLAALAAAIKVAPRKLDALENDRLQDLPDATFARALAQTVCRTLRIDAAPVLALLPSHAVSLEPAASKLNAPFRDRSSRDDGVFGSAAVKPMVAAAALLMLAAVIVWFLPDGALTSAFDWRSSSDAPPPAAVAEPAPTPVAAAPRVDAAGSAAAVVASAAPQAASAPLSTADAPAGETVFAAPPPTAALAPVTAAALQLSATEPSWVEVRDGGGEVLLSRTVQPGETVGLDGAAPLRLTIGNAAATQLQFRGRPVDVVGRSRDNVARLELP